MASSSQSIFSRPASPPPRTASPSFAAFDPLPPPLRSKRSARAVNSRPPPPLRPVPSRGILKPSPPSSPSPSLCSSSSYSSGSGSSGPYSPSASSSSTRPPPGSGNGTPNLSHRRSLQFAIPYRSPPASPTLSAPPPPVPPIPAFVLDDTQQSPLSRPRSRLPRHEGGVGVGGGKNTRTAGITCTEYLSNCGGGRRSVGQTCRV